MAQLAGFNERSLAHLEAAVAAHSAAGRVVEAARVTGALGYALDYLGRGELAITLIRQALASLEATTAPPEVVAELQVRLGELTHLRRSPRRGDRADRGGAHLGAAPRAWRAAGPGSQLQGLAPFSRRACRGGRRAVRAVRLCLKARGPAPHGADGGGQPGRPLHDPRPPGGRRARRGGARARPALGTQEPRGCRGGQPHVRPHDGGAPWRGDPARHRAPPSRGRRAARSRTGPLLARLPRGVSWQRPGRPRARCSVPRLGR